MKKKLLVTAILTLAVASVGVTACSNKAETAAASAAETTAAAAETAGPAATAEEVKETEEEEVEIEEEYMSGLITAISNDDRILTVKDDEDQTEKNYNIADAELIQEYAFSEGDWVEICYPADTTEDPIPAMVVEVLDSVIAQNTDPSEEGVIVDAAMNSITIEVDGENYTLSTSNAYIVASNGIQTGKLATVTYIGDLDDDAMAVKIVMEDSYDTDEAQICALIGEVVQIGEEGENIVLESEQGDFFTFVSDDIDFSEYAEGDILQIEYIGTITAKEVPAVEVIKK